MSTRNKNSLTVGGPLKRLLFLPFRNQRIKLRARVSRRGDRYHLSQQGAVRGTHLRPLTIFARRLWISMRKQVNTMDYQQPQIVVLGQPSYVIHGGVPKQIFLE